MTSNFPHSAFSASPRSEPIASEITALLGPTNTGKTHRAVERLLEHDTGMLGLPLRLLAREVYDRITARIGEDAVALVTGEERRIPRRPRYWVCTVEAMPVSLDVDFLAVDEVQLVEHPQRGHVFTERLLHARGRIETWFLGAPTVESLLSRLVPTAKTRRHPRLSELRYRGSRSLSSLPPRSIVVTFTVAHVYELADAIRRKKGGAAIVLGDLSPRARNAQVALYQSGDVDYLVATDAVGMGLNLDVDHVALAKLHKFDGKRVRPLELAEIAQIAGRAGRYVRNGTFGTLNPLPELPPRAVAALERHEFASVAKARWRNADLDTSSLDALRESLLVRPRQHALRLTHDADDARTLARLSARADVQELANGRERVSLLWEVCQVPDYGRMMPERHASVVADIFFELVRAGCLGDEFLRERVVPIDVPTGDIHSLMARLTAIRTWTYATHRDGWVENSQEWRDRALAIEERLSDALHQALVARFADRGSRRSAVARRAPRPVMAAKGSTSSSAAAGGPFAKLLTLGLDLEVQSDDANDGWVDAFIEAPFDDLELTPGAMIRYGDVTVARLTRGSSLINPQAVLLDVDDLSGADRLRMERRLRAWVRDAVSRTLGDFVARPPATLSPPLRGLVYQLGERLGTIDGRAAREQLDTLDQEARACLSEQGVVIGRRCVYVRNAHARDAIVRRAAFAAAYFGAELVAPEFLGDACVAPRSKASPSELLSIGYVALGRYAVRADVVESVLAELGAASRRGPFVIPRRLLDVLGIEGTEVAGILLRLGFRVLEDGRRAVRSKGRRRRLRR